MTPTQAPAVLAGFTEVKAPDFELQMPKDWKVIDFTDAEMDKKIEDMAKNDPEMGKMLPQLKVMASQGQFKFFAFDLDKTEDGFTDNLNVIVQEAKNVSLDQLVKLNKDQLAQMAGKAPDELRRRARMPTLAFFAGVRRHNSKTSDSTRSLPPTPRRSLRSPLRAMQSTMPRSARQWSRSCRRSPSSNELKKESAPAELRVGRCFVSMG